MYLNNVNDPSECNNKWVRGREAVNAGTKTKRKRTHSHVRVRVKVGVRLGVRVKDRLGVKIFFLR